MMRSLACFLSVVGVAALCQAQSHLGTNFWDINWGDGACDGFKNTYWNVDPNDPNPWREDFLDEIQIYSTLRFMDYGNTNSPFAWPDLHQGTKWSDRTQKTDKVQRPVAYEYMIDLCNRTRTNMWVCVMEFADDEYITNLARLINQELLPPLKVYVEWSNETWNGMFSSFNLAIQKGQEMDLPGGNEWYKGRAYHAYMALRAGRIFRDEFGDDSGRVVIVFAGQASDLSVCGHHMSVLADPKVNPHNMLPDVYAIAPYAHDMSQGVLDQTVTWGQQHKAAIKAKDARIKLAYYEGGVEVETHTPGMYEAVTKYMQAHMPIVEDNFAYYMHAGTARWGSKWRIGEDESLAHAYRALKDWSVANNPPKPELVLVRKGTMARPVPVSAQPYALVRSPAGGWQCAVALDEPYVLELADGRGRIVGRYAGHAPGRHVVGISVRAGLFFIRLKTARGEHAGPIMIY